MAQAHTKGYGHELRNINTSIGNQYLHQRGSTKWASALNSDASSKCATFLVSTNATLCHVTWRLDNPTALPG